MNLNRCHNADIRMCNTYLEFVIGNVIGIGERSIGLRYRCDSSGRRCGDRLHRIDSRCRSEWGVKDGCGE